MAGVLVDSNVLLDIMNQSPMWYAWSAAAFARAANTGRLIINPIVYSEISVNFDSIEELDATLPKHTIEREPLPFEASFLAGKAYLQYRRLGGTKLSLLPDFLIGAHAAVEGYQILTRDRARYRTYFPKVFLLTPTD